MVSCVNYNTRLYSASKITCVVDELYVSLHCPLQTNLPGCIRFICCAQESINRTYSDSGLKYWEDTLCIKY